MPSRLIAALGLLFLSPLASHAYVLDWNTVDWTTVWGGTPATSVSQTFNNVDASGVNVTISITRGGGATITNGTTTPDDVNNPITNAGNEPALMVDIDYGNNERTTTYRYDDTGTGGSNASYLEFTITFSGAVNYIDFDLWDIDLGNDNTPSRYQDVVVFDPNGATANLSLIGTNTDSQIYTDANGNEAVRGIRADNASNNAGNENDTSESANVNVSYGTTAVTSVTFRYYSGSGERGPLTDITFAGTDPTLQRIALHDINFTNAPEPSTWISGGLLVLFVGGQAWRRRSSRQAAA